MQQNNPNPDLTPPSGAETKVKSREQRSRIRKFIHTPPLITFRKLLFRIKRRLAAFWRKRSESKPPHWVKDLLDLLKWVNLLPTFFVMAFAPRHFFTRTPEIRRSGSGPYKTPIKFLLSAIPFIVGLHWLPTAWLYRNGAAFVLSRGVRLAVLGLERDWCCFHAFSRAAFAGIRGLHWLEKASDTQVVWVVLIGIPLWVPLVSCFVALVLLFPRLLNVVRTQTILPLLVSADLKTYIRLRWNDYSWNLLYFAVYFVLAFPICLLALYGIYRGFVSPPFAVLRFGPLRLWWMATQSALAVSLVTSPYNALLQASVVIPTPLMQMLRLSKMNEILEQFKGAIMLAQRGDFSMIERLATESNSECSRLRARNKRQIKRAERRGKKWIDKLSKETAAAFGRLNVALLLQAQQFPLPALSLERLAAVSEFLISNGSQSQPKVPAPAVPITRRIARDSLLVLLGVMCVLLVIWFVVYLTTP
jgi:hypothetical protein